MKKIINYLLLIVMLGGCAATFFGCGGAPVPSDNLTVTIADFEEWAPGFQLMKLMDNFGAVTVNENAEFVKEGKRSAKLQPTGGYSQKTMPWLWFPLTSELFDYNYADWTRVEAILFDIYNDQSDERRIEIGAMTGYTDITSANKLKGAVYFLNPGWNRIAYVIDQSFINLMYDVTFIPGFYIGFDNAGVRDKDDAPVYYLDNLCVRTRPQPVEVKDLIVLDEFEICDFEKSYQRNIVSASVQNLECMPELGVVSAAVEGITATGGEMVLKLVTKPANSQPLDKWDKFIIPEKVLQKSKLTRLTDGEIGEYQLSFDVYAKDFASGVHFQSYGAGGTNFLHSVKKEGETESVWDSSTVLGEWKTVSIPLTDMGDNAKNPGDICVSWAEYFGRGEAVYYFDNFRIEKIGSLPETE